MDIKTVDWIAGFFTLVSLELVTRRKWQGWAVGLAGQVAWFAYIFNSAAWGLLSVTALMTIRYYRSMIAWRSEPGVAADIPN